MDVSIGQLQQAIEDRYGGRGVPVSAQFVKQMADDKTIWEGVVHVFSLQSHPSATKAYAWSAPVEGSDDLRRVYAVLELGAVRTPLDAVWSVSAAEATTVKAVTRPDPIEVGRKAYELERSHGRTAHVYAARLATEALAEGQTEEYDFWTAVAGALTPRDSNPT
jgi:hypothetical protein